MDRPGQVSEGFGRVLSSHPVKLFRPPPYSPHTSGCVNHLAHGFFCSLRRPYSGVSFVPGRPKPVLNFKLG